MKQIFGENWKTTSAGITAIVGAIVGIIYAVKGGQVTPEVITGAVTALLAGIGLIFAGDAKA